MQSRDHRNDVKNDALMFPKNRPCRLRRGVKRDGIRGEQERLRRDKPIQPLHDEAVLELDLAAQHAVEISIGADRIGWLMAHDAARRRD